MTAAAGLELGDANVQRAAGNVSTVHSSGILWWEKHYTCCHVMSDIAAYRGMVAGGTMVGMARHRVLASVSLAALSLLPACKSQSCTLVAAVPGVVVDTADYPIDRPEDVEVCLDDRCVPLHEIEEPSLDRGGSETVIRVEGDDRERTIVIRSQSGQILAGPAVVDLPLLQPNGEGCPGAALQGRFRVDADGVIG